MNWLIPLLAALFAAGGLHLNTERLVEQAHEDFPPLGERVEVDGWPTHVVDRGQGPAVLLLHGIGGSARVWSGPLLDTLVATGHRTIAPDRPGHGLSVRPEGMSGDPREQAAFIHELLATLEVERPVFLVAQSWGATVAVAFGLLYPDEVAGIFFISPYLNPGHRVFNPAYDLATTPVWSQLTLQTVAVPVSQQGRRVFARMMFHPDPVPEYWFGNELLLSQTPEGLRVSAQDMRVVAPAMREMAPHYGDLPGPVTAVVGLNDLIVDPMPTLRFASRHRWRTVTLHHTGHAVLIVETERVIEALFETLDEADWR